MTSYVHAATVNTSHEIK